MTAYNDRFYDAIRQGCQRSAAAVAPLVDAYAGPFRSVVDIGCGEGWWADAFADLGATTVVGYDSGTRPNPAPIDHRNLDLRSGLIPPGEYDLAICLEVAEHLPEESAWGLVRGLTHSAPVVLFSAAMPHQGGTGHVNCQPPAYWGDLFAEQGFECHDVIRRAVWNDENVEPWYRSNILIFADPEATDLPAPTGPPLHIIHPDLWLDPR